MTEGTAINYSVERLKKDEGERIHIVNELNRIKQEYRICNCTVLEVGCGIGSNLRVFNRDNSTIGIEGLGAAVTEARSRGLPVSAGNLEVPLGVETGRVDWVLCLDVLEHLVNPWGLLTEIRRVLRDKGRAIINVPNHFTLSGRIRLLFGHDLDVCGYFPERHEWENPHVRFFTYRGIRDMAHAAGFRISEDRSEHFPAFPKLASLRRLGLGWAVPHLARMRPSLFAAGFFLIIQKN